jgi:hypothetical protein
MPDCCRRRTILRISSRAAGVSVRVSIFFMRTILPDPHLFKGQVNNSTGYPHPCRPSFCFDSA